MSSAPTFLRTVSSVSPNSWRRSLWPTIPCWQPTSASMGADTSPVNAPCFSQWTFCAATSMAEPLAAWTAAASAVNGGATATWTLPASVAQRGAELADERRRLGDGLVHLPVAADELLAGHAV